MWSGYCGQSRVQYGKKKCGRHQQNCLHYAEKYGFEEKIGGIEYEESLRNNTRVHNAANNRGVELRSSLATPTLCKPVMNLSARYGWEKSTVYACIYMHVYMYICIYVYIKYTSFCAYGATTIITYTKNNNNSSNYIHA